MPYSIEELPNESVILLTFQPGFSAEELADSAAELTKMLDAQSEPVYFILDMTSISLSLDDVIAGANMATRGSKPPFHHPNVRGVVFVSGNNLIKLAAQGLKTATFGNTAVQVFETLDKALAYTSK
jgi:hypothetical protein